MRELVADEILDRCDVAGRPLGEQASRRSGEVHSKLIACPYRDVRRGVPMNATAYRQVEAHWTAVLAALREATGPTASDAWRATCRLRWLPLSLPDPLAEETAAIFKAALGIGRPLTSWLLLNPGSASGSLEDLVPSEQFLGRLDEEGWLLGSAQVCAGPPARILEAWMALAEPAGTTNLPADALADADRATDLVVALWALLGAAREVLREGRWDEAPNWSSAGPVDPSWPEILRILRLDGPGALVREVPRFEPEWALNVYDTPPEAVAVAVRRARQAITADAPFAALDIAWTDCRRGL
jgi:hypothetical protein